MGLAGILTVALIVSADQTNAGGIDGMRAVTAFTALSEQDPPAVAIPVLTGLLDGIRDLPIFAPAPTAAPAPIVPLSTAPGEPAPATVVSPAPATTPSVATPTPPVAPAPTATPAPAAVTPAPPPSPLAPAPVPGPTSTPAPALGLATDRGVTAVVNLADLVPGDTIDRTITLANTGSLPFRYTVSAAQTASTPLWTDTAFGLQLTVSTGSGTVLYTGPLSGLGALGGPSILAPGSSELLRYTFAFPASASDAFQGLVQDLTLVFTATQYP